ncbi:FecR family protein [Mucilaginibacter ximonensis]|uniref:FecR family protein n=1 Tax=Mucilaginibacter ximonensis TaxID=538021 RepID=A0ABW5YGT0_9SPHI
MEKKQFLAILKKHRLGETTEQEEAYLAAYYNLFDSEPDVTELLNDHEIDFLKNQIRDNIKEKISSPQQQPAPKPNKFYYWLKLAAVVLLFFLAGILTFNKYKKVNLVSNNDVAPGSNRAVLMLANGRQIILNNAKSGFLAQQGGIQIHKASSGQLVYQIKNVAANSDTGYNTITTPRGGQFVVVLSDNSTVCLNANSSIRFPAAFSGKYRTVSLTGEAYFEVAHNKAMPFHVITHNQTVEVLGTHFNINAYDDENVVKTTLLEGSVRILAGNNTALLAPGQQSQIGKGSGSYPQISIVKNANTEEAVAWKNGFFQFENADLKTVMRQFARWYNVEAEFDGNTNKRLFSGEIHRNLSLLKALELLNYADVNFKVDGRKIIITQ